MCYTCMLKSCNGEVRIVIVKREIKVTIILYVYITVNVLIIEPKKINSNLEMVLIWNQKELLT